MNSPALIGGPEPGVGTIPVPSISGVVQIAVAKMFAHRWIIVNHDLLRKHA
jgi:hypothetical protein